MFLVHSPCPLPPSLCESVPLTLLHFFLCILCVWHDQFSVAKTVCDPPSLFTMFQHTNVFPYTLPNLYIPTMYFHNHPWPTIRYIIISSVFSCFTMSHNVFSCLFDVIVWVFVWGILFDICFNPAPECTHSSYCPFIDFTGSLYFHFT